MTEAPTLFRVALEVGDLDSATDLYRQLFSVEAPVIPVPATTSTAAASSLPFSTSRKAG